MKKVMLLAASVSYLLVGTAIPVSAQVGQPTMLKGDVPFAFVSGDRTIPAGQCSIQIRQSQVRFLDANGHPVQAIFSNPRQENGSQEKPRLVFHQYGEAYFLWQIWTRDYKVDFRTSRAEYNLKASLQAEPATWTLAMR